MQPGVERHERSLSRCCPLHQRTYRATRFHLPDPRCLPMRGFWASLGNPPYPPSSDPVEARAVAGHPPSPARCTRKSGHTRPPHPLLSTTGALWGSVHHGNHDEYPPPPHAATAWQGSGAAPPAAPSPAASLARSHSRRPPPFPACRCRESGGRRTPLRRAQEAVLVTSRPLSPLLLRRCRVALARCRISCVMFEAISLHTFVPSGVLFECHVA